MPAELVFPLGLASGLMIRQFFIWRHRRKERSQRHARLTQESIRWRQGGIR